MRPSPPSENGRDHRDADAPHGNPAGVGHSPRTNQFRAPPRSIFRGADPFATPRDRHPAGAARKRQSSRIEAVVDFVGVGALFAIASRPRVHRSGRRSKTRFKVAGHRGCRVVSAARLGAN